MTIAFKDVLIGGILVLGMTVIAYIPLLLEDRQRRRFDRERYLEKFRISTAKILSLIESIKKENEELLKLSSERGA